MLIQVVSDLHLEFMPSEYISSTLPRRLSTNADILVIAGDLGVIHRWDKIAMLLEKLALRYEHILWVLGNHEYYGGSIQEGNEFLEQVKDLFNRRVEILSRKTKTIGGVKFVGATLWFIETQEAMTRQYCLADFSAIRDAGSIFGHAEADLAFLRKEITEECVVITHHLPSMQSVNERYKDSSINCYFVNYDAEKLPVWPRLWIHGHTHYSADHVVGKTRVLCNPHGYWGQADLNGEFKHKLTVNP